MEKENETSSVKCWGIFIFISVVALFVIYAIGVLAVATGKTGGFGLPASGTAGDTFGALTALFSGLAFAGLIVTMLMQRQELELQRKELRDNRAEFKKSADAQEQNAKLAAITTLLNEYTDQLKKIELARSNRDPRTGLSVYLPITAGEEAFLIAAREVLIRELEGGMQEYGIELPDENEYREQAEARS